MAVLHTLADYDRRIETELEGMLSQQRYVRGYVVDCLRSLHANLVETRILGRILRDLRGSVDVVGPGAVSRLGVALEDVPLGYITRALGGLAVDLVTRGALALNNHSRQLRQDSESGEDGGVILCLRRGSHDPTDTQRRERDLDDHREALLRVLLCAAAMIVQVPGDPRAHPSSPTIGGT